ncbi:phosphotransferase family protein [Haladaptatus pallidirubidus]|uniref:Aminoglycoside phosphotransferase domain-containing protein n=1 Tax=Haladaptatus pallidirubidus TaxID=1008152 RepID=A0AAV3UKE1_9EURY|nr:aminoglycoside phosphotransferase family protein [Haladaptatus pallidirubidus]
MLSQTTITELVHGVYPQWTVTAVDAVDQGLNQIYILQITADEQVPQQIDRDEFPVILKYCTTTDPDIFRQEPQILTQIASATDIPVPQIFGTGSTIDETPFFLMEYCDGENYEGNMTTLSSDIQYHLAHTAGQHLAELHQSWKFSHFGTIIADRDMLSVKENDRGWPEYFSTLVEHPLASLENEEPFADLVPELRRTLTNSIKSLAGNFQAKFAHNDYRLGNFLIEPETGRIRTVLDWESAIAAPPEYDLVKTEQLLCNYGSHDSEFRTRIRNGLQDGYTRNSTWPTRLEKQRDVYLLGTRLPAMQWMTQWYTGSERNTAETRHRQALANLL